MRFSHWLDELPARGFLFDNETTKQGGTAPVKPRALVRPYISSGFTRAFLLALKERYEKQKENIFWDPGNREIAYWQLFRNA